MLKKIKGQIADLPIDFSAGPSINSSLFLYRTALVNIINKFIDIFDQTLGKNNEENILEPYVLVENAF